MLSLTATKVYAMAKGDTWEAFNVLYNALVDEYTADCKYGITDYDSFMEFIDYLIGDLWEHVETGGDAPLNAQNKSVMKDLSRLL